MILSKGELVDYTFETECSVNAIYVLDGLSSNDLQTAKRLANDDLRNLGEENEIAVIYYKVNNESDIENIFNYIEDGINGGNYTYPMLHFDFHGSGDKTGLAIPDSEEVITWSYLARSCRRINEMTNNNTVIVMPACFGFHSILSVSISELTPYFSLIGPQQTVEAGFIDKNFPKFYRTLFETGEISSAMKEIQEHYYQYLSEKIFFNSFSGYIKTACQGRGKDERVEELLTIIIKKRGDDISEIGKIRKELRQLIKPDEETFQRFKNRFLMADHSDNADRFTCTFDDMMNFIS